ncbi:hypothetical protein PYCC9005_002207 [Savitreella phatthalungensis]
MVDSNSRAQDPSTVGSSDVPRAAPPPGYRSILFRLARVGAIVFCVQFAFRHGLSFVKQELLPAGKHEWVDSARTNDQVFSGEVESSEQISRGSQSVHPLWTEPDTRVDVAVWLSQERRDAVGDMIQLVVERGVQVGNWSDVRGRTLQFGLPSGLTYNSSWYTHVSVSKAAIESDLEDIRPQDVMFQSSKELTRWLPNDVSGGVAAYWPKSVKLALVGDPGDMVYASIPTHVARRLVFDRKSSTDSDGYYFPICYVDDFWQLHEEMVTVETGAGDSPTLISIDFEFRQVKMSQMQLMSKVEQYVSMMDPHYQDKLKGWFIFADEYKPWIGAALVVLTIRWFSSSNRGPEEYSHQS